MCSIKRLNIGYKNLVPKEFREFMPLEICVSESLKKEASTALA